MNNKEYIRKEKKYSFKVAISNRKQGIVEREQEQYPKPQKILPII